MPKDVIGHFKTKPSLEMYTNSSLQLCYGIHVTAGPVFFIVNLHVNILVQTAYSNNTINRIFVCSIIRSIFPSENIDVMDLFKS